MAGDTLRTSDLKGQDDHTRQVRDLYTTWSVRDRRLLVILLGYLALASSLTANIYFPLIDLLAVRYGVSVQAINLTITLYIVVQGIVPSFWSPLSDTLGRRPVYLATFTVFTIASLVLSIVDRNYPALLVLRALQSVGASGIVSLAYATVADVVVHAERGAYLSPLLTITNLGPVIGPVIGGGLALASGDPRWCFRVLAIFGGTSALLIGLAMPETERSIVGNGAVPAHGIWNTWWRLFLESKIPRLFRGSSGGGGPQAGLPKKEAQGVNAEVNAGRTGRGRYTLPNLWPTIRIVFYADTCLILWLAGSPSAIWFCVQTSLSPIFSGQYGFNPLEVGLCFLAGGVGVIAAGFVAGRLMDWNYRCVAKEVGFSIDRVRGDDMKNFPIERARSRWSITIIVMSVGLIVGYGWVVEAKVHPAVPLVFQAFIGCRCTTLHQTYGALIVDIFPEKTGAAAASKNIIRCTLAGILVAILDLLVANLGYGWTFTCLGLFDASTCIMASAILNKWGMEWRRKRDPDCQTS
ncbi:major facilitator superfamily transporter [Xylariomycetidae sp. FL2044]|nr:major facilitator superfamily transporter [Xylariomycetidae sp. FL2044]